MSSFRSVQLALNPDLAKSYSNPAQIARIVTEVWAADNLFCPACTSDLLEPTPTDTAVVDFLCPCCEEPFQLKSQSRPFGSRVSDSAYRPMIRSIEKGTVPTFLFLRYDRALWTVRELFFVPRHFISPSVVEERPRLRPTARRAGWVGCNILLSALPPDARVYVVRSGVSLPSQKVRAAWRQFSFLRKTDPEARGWTADVLACVRGIRKSTFSLGEVYAFEDRLGSLHPRNRNVRPKIRQQLQYLRDHGILEFVERGKYRTLRKPKQ